MSSRGQSVQALSLDANPALAAQAAQVREQFKPIPAGEHDALVAFVAYFVRLNQTEQRFLCGVVQHPHNATHAAREAGISTVTYYKLRRRFQQRGDILTSLLGNGDI